MWCGVVWCGVVWCGVVWCGVVWCGVVWCSVVWCGQAGKNNAKKKMEIKVGIEFLQEIFFENILLRKTLLYEKNL